MNTEQVEGNHTKLAPAQKFYLHARVTGGRATRPRANRVCVADLSPSSPDYYASFCLPTSPALFFFSVTPCFFSQISHPHPSLPDDTVPLCGWQAESRPVGGDADATSHTSRRGRAEGWAVGTAPQYRDEYTPTSLAGDHSLGRSVRLRPGIPQRCPVDLPHPQSKGCPTVVYEWRTNVYKISSQR